MRLTTEEQNAIRKVIYQADPEAQIWLFGSRADDQARGGGLTCLSFQKKLGLKDRAGIRLALYDLIGEQKIDLVIAADDTDPFTRIALAEGVRL